MEQGSPTRRRIERTSQDIEYDECLAQDKLRTQELELVEMLKLIKISELEEERKCLSDLEPVLATFQIQFRCPNKTFKRRFYGNDRWDDVILRVLKSCWWTMAP